MVGVRMLIENPDEVEVTLKLTLKVKDWALLRDQMGAQRTYPVGRVKDAISDALARVRKIVYATDPTGDELG